MAVQNKIKVDEIVFRETLPLCQYVDQVSLTANTAKTVTVPSWAIGGIMNLSSTTLTSWAVRADGGTAVLPAADKTDGTGSAAQVGCRQITVSTFSIIADTTGVISIEYYPRNSGN